jgi:hypothetical protein
LMRPTNARECCGATSEVRARMPPSPRLSARSTYARYLSDTTTISDQNTSEHAPITLESLTSRWCPWKVSRNA